MALPTPEKTWQYDVNIAVGGIATDVDTQDAFFKFKEALVGFASGHWTVASSSTGAGTPDLTDQWASRTDLGMSTGDHAWIVLTNSANNAQICIDMKVGGTSSQDAQVYFSAGGGYATTGLVLTDRPTPPADEQQYSVNFLGVSPTGFASKLHVMMSDDGECTRAVTTRANKASSLFLLDSVKNPEAGWTNPVVSVCSSLASPTDSITYARFSDADPMLGWMGAAVPFFLTSEGYGSNNLGESAAGLVANTQTSGWVMCPIGLVSDTVGYIGRKGELYDLWWGSPTRSTGDSYPAAGTYLFAQFGHMILPWSGVLPQVS